jgi:hypothetical protein
MLGERLINLVKAVIEREISESMQRKGPERELNAEEASDKPRRDTVTERRSMRDGIVP